jgi:Inhibitor of Apoptosis domain
MAKAGFIAAGDKTYRCFSCGLILLDTPEDPFFEHTRLNPLCPYIGSVKSSGYIAHVTATYTDPRKPWELLFTST